MYPFTSMTLGEGNSLIFVMIRQECHLDTSRKSGESNFGKKTEVFTASPRLVMHIKALFRNINHVVSCISKCYYTYKMSQQVTKSYIYVNFPFTVLYNWLRGTRYPHWMNFVFTVCKLLPLGPDRYIGWPILSADTGLSQINRYCHTVHQYVPILKRF